MKLYSIIEVAGELGVHSSTIYRWQATIENFPTASARKGRKRLYTREDINAMKAAVERFRAAQKPRESRIKLMTADPVRKLIRTVRQRATEA
jgi:transposase